MATIPQKMKNRPKDRRGYPIPYVVMIDKDGRPHFTISDQAKAQKVIHDKLCGICGTPLKEGAWFIGGPMCFLDERGAFIDPPMHEECARYAIKVCPFIAAPNYSNRIDDRTLSEEAKPDGVVINEIEMPPEQPCVFGLGQVSAYAAVPHQGSLVLVPQSSWHQLEFWHNGEQLTERQTLERLVEGGLIERSVLDAIDRET